MLSAAPSLEVSDSDAFRIYYTENDFFLAPEGILKVLFVMICIVCAVLFLSGAGGACHGAPGLAASSATVSLVSAAGVALLYAGVALDLPLHAPQPWFYTDIIVSTVLGILVLVTAVLSMTVCELSSAVDYLYGPLGLVGAGAVTASAARTHAAAMRRRDAPHTHTHTPTPTHNRSDNTELEV